MAAAAHGASFPMARKVRAGMTLQQLSEFEGPTKGLPKHVKGSRGVKAPKSPKAVKGPSKRMREDEYDSSYGNVPGTLNTASSFPRRKR